ncbi:MAG: nitroreductase [Clostridia bacterium]|nr:nitroreductase [Clostridia bacterium]
MMVNIKKEWYDAIFQRRSRRQFENKPLKTEEINYLTDFSHQLNESFTGARVEIVNKNPEQVFKGLVGSYGKIKDAPLYAAFIGDMKDPNVQEKVGYIGECLLLEATARGLATCWVGGFFRPEAVKDQVGIDDSEQVLAVTPLGYAPEQYTFGEKLMAGFATVHKRKDIDSLCSGGFNQDWPQWVKTALEAGRLAPSAVNRQPWRFTVNADSIKVSVDTVKDTYNISKRLDCGIAMLHIEVGAWKEGVRGKWHYVNHPDVAVFMVE